MTCRGDRRRQTGDHIRIDSRPDRSIAGVSIIPSQVFTDASRFRSLFDVENAKISGRWNILRNALKSGGFDIDQTESDDNGA